MELSRSVGCVVSGVSMGILGVYCRLAAHQEGMRKVALSMSSALLGFGAILIVVGSMGVFAALKGRREGF